MFHIIDKLFLVFLMSFIEITVHFITIISTYIITLI